MYGLLWSSELYSDCEIQMSAKDEYKTYNDLYLWDLQTLTLLL